VGVIGAGHGHAFSTIRALRKMPEYDLAGVCKLTRASPRRLSLKEILGDASTGLVASKSADVERDLEHTGQCV